MFRLVSDNWEAEVTQARSDNPRGLLMVCPFIKDGATKRLLSNGEKRSIRIITRFDLGGFYDGVSDTSALRRLLDAGAKIRGVKRLHAKLFLFGRQVAIGTSANLTDGGMLRNHEFGFVSDEHSVVANCEEYFDDLWNRAGDDLKHGLLQEWDDQLAIARRADGARRRPRLPDYGKNVGARSPLTVRKNAFHGHPAFLKFFGRGSERTPRDESITEIVAESGCNWACTFPSSRKPRQISDGDLIYMARIAAPDDILIFGSAIAWRHRDDEDVATAAEIAARPWKRDWANYIRVHKARFVNARLGVGVSMYEMLEALGSDSFQSTEENERHGTGNTDPWRSYLRKPGMRLTPASTSWIDERLEELFRLYGEVDLSRKRFQSPR